MYARNPTRGTTKKLITKPISKQHQSSPRSLPVRKGDRGRKALLAVKKSNEEARGKTQRKSTKTQMKSTALRLSLPGVPWSGASATTPKLSAIFGNTSVKTIDTEMSPQNLKQKVQHSQLPQCSQPPREQNLRTGCPSQPENHHPYKCLPRALPELPALTVLRGCSRSKCSRRSRVEVPNSRWLGSCRRWDALKKSS